MGRRIVTYDLLPCGAAIASIFFSPSSAHAQAFLSILFDESPPGLRLLPGGVAVLLLAALLFALTNLRLRRLVDRRTAELNAKNSELKGQATELLAVHATLRKKNEYLEQVLHSDLIGILFWDAQGNITAANDFFLSLVGYSREEMEQGRLQWTAITPPEYVPLDQQALQEIQQTGRFSPFEKEYLRKDGRRVPILLGGACLESDRKRGVAFVLDLSERKRNEERLRNSEERLRQSQKMEAMGRLAGGVAHDFNNLLTVINGYSTMLLGKVSGVEGGTRRAVEEISKAGTRAGKLTQQLLAFSRQQVLAPKVLEPNAVVVEMSTLLERLLGEDIELEVELGDGLGTIRADAGQLQQVIMNLVVNARDAMPKGGRVRLETSAIRIKPGDGPALAGLGYGSESIPPGDYCVLSVSDEGSGMTDDVLEHVFEPFFTTKDLGKGTGLGLSTVYGIVKQSEGFITVQTKLGIGSTFRVFLPCREGVPAFDDATRLAGSLPRGQEFVLVVEDDEYVRTLVKELLTAQGYTVHTADHPFDALAFIENHSGRIDLLLTDVIMPGMSGRDLAQRVSAARPDMRVLFMSGYTDDAMLLHGVQSSEIAFIAKPFSVQSLASKVRDVLDAAPRGAAATPAA